MKQKLACLRAAAAALALAVVALVANSRRRWVDWYGLAWLGMSIRAGCFSLVRKILPSFAVLRVLKRERERHDGVELAFEWMYVRRIFEPCTLASTQMLYACIGGVPRLAACTFARRKDPRWAKVSRSPFPRRTAPSFPSSSRGGAVQTEWMSRGR